MSAYHAIRFMLVLFRGKNKYVNLVYLLLCYAVSSAQNSTVNEGNNRALVMPPLPNRHIAL